MISLSMKELLIAEDSSQDPMVLITIRHLRRMSNDLHNGVRTGMLFVMPVHD